MGKCSPTVSEKSHQTVSDEDRRAEAEDQMMLRFEITEKKKHSAGTYDVSTKTGGLFETTRHGAEQGHGANNHLEIDAGMLKLINDQFSILSSDLYEDKPEPPVGGRLHDAPKANFASQNPILTMAEGRAGGQGGRGGYTAYVDEVKELDDARMEARFKQLDQRVKDAMEARFRQLDQSVKDPIEARFRQLDQSVMAAMAVAGNSIKATMAEGRAGGQGGRGGYIAYVDEVKELNDAAREARMEARFRQLDQSVKDEMEARFRQLDQSVKDPIEARFRQLDQSVKDPIEARFRQLDQSVMAAMAVAGNPIKAWFQPFEQRVMEAFGVLTNQMAAMAAGGNPLCYCSVQSQFLKEEEVFDNFSIIKPLAGNHADEAAIVSFTSGRIPDPIVDWSKSAVFDEDPMEKITKEKNQKILQKEVAMLDEGEIGWGDQFVNPWGLSLLG